MAEFTPPQKKTCKTLRYSNIELLRILAMLAIIGHHYVVNSSVVDQYNYENTSAQQYFLEVWGLWGKTAINSFMLISGFFLCTMKLTLQRYIKLLFQVMFYGIVISLIFGITRYDAFSLKTLFGIITHPLKDINNSFTASFLCFYAFVPFYNKLLEHCTRKELLLLVAGSLVVMSGCACFFKAQTMNEPVWYMTLYFLAAYFRKYPNRYTDSLRLTATLLVLSVLAAVVINIGSIYLANSTGNIRFTYYRNYFLINSNMPLAFLIGTTAFLTFKNLPQFYSKTINFLAAGTFAVLLIHASSDTMRHWLWQDICKVPEMINAPVGTLVLQALCVPVIIFLVCTSIDYLRRQYIEKPIFSFLNSKITVAGAAS